MRGAIDQITRQYKKYSLWIIAALMLLALLGMQLFQETEWVMALAVAVVFSLIFSMVYGSCWKAVAKSSPLSLTRFYIAGSVFRLLLSAIVFLVYALVVRERRAVLGFAFIFAIFYIVLLAFDSFYFFRVEKKLKN